MMGLGSFWWLCSALRTWAGSCSLGRDPRARREARQAPPRSTSCCAAGRPPWSTRTWRRTPR
jgi:hypothetical protein